MWMFSQVALAISHKFSDSTSVWLTEPQGKNLLSIAGALSLGAARSAERRRRQQRELCDGEWPGHGTALRSSALLPAWGKPSEPEPCRAALGSAGILDLRRSNIASHPSRHRTAAPTWLPQLLLGVRLCSSRRGKAARRCHLCGNPDCGTPEPEQMGHGQRGHGKPPGCAWQLIRLARPGCETRCERPRGSKHECRNTPVLSWDQKIYFCCWG